MAYLTTISELGLRDRIAGLAARFAEARRRRATYLQTVRELSALSNRDLDDLGISRLAIDDIAYAQAYGK